jgi:hypothetical protein
MVTVKELALFEKRLYSTTCRDSRYCPSCKQIVETRVLLEGYCQTEVQGILAKKRQVICGTDTEGSNACGTTWFTLELLEDHLLSPTGKRGIFFLTKD